VTQADGTPRSALAQLSWSRGGAGPGLPKLEYKPGRGSPGAFLMDYLDGWSLPPEAEEGRNGGTPSTSLAWVVFGRDFA
jgi:hypothetical protein